jgi:integrase
MASQPHEPREDTRGYWFTQWHDEHRRRHTKTFGSTARVSHAEAMRRWRAFLRAWYVDPHEHKGRPTVAGLCEAYIEHCRGIYRRGMNDTSEADNVDYALRPFMDRFGSLEPDALRPRHLKLYQEQLAKSVCRSTVKARVNILRRFAKWAASEELMSSTVWHDWQTVPTLRRGEHGVKDSDPVTAVADAIVDATLAKLPPTLQAMVKLQRLTGMRPGEVVQVRPRDVNTGAVPWRFDPEHHKTQHHGHERPVFFGPAARAVLAPYLKRDLEARCFQPVEAVKQRRGKKPRRRIGTSYTTRSYRKALWYACDAAGVPRWNPNQLRHSAEQRIEREFGVDVARTVLGHSKVETTEHYRNRHDFSEAARVMERVG